MKIFIKHRTVQAQGQNRINPGTIPERGKLVMLAMQKREGLPSPQFFVPVVSMGFDKKTELGYFKFATETDIRNARAFPFMPGEIWWELPRNPLWTPEQKIAPDADVRAMLDETAASIPTAHTGGVVGIDDKESAYDSGTDAGSADAGTANEGTD